ncbi:DUF3256 family protein [Prevotella sp. E2-28]|uniref:DUF3256 family protein n=1 Tax=Prevotella sp. E2-28 TaxID=2913620 RepID=UPI001EDC5C88|nr:DUF3256 family protein [Prevotella sp. E2-28]UKK52502.1 DUF3256 family protein [Prevotella sp. E2-28]
MKKILLLSFLLSGHLFVLAQTKPLNIREVFKQMPDSLLPYLTNNNRLDMMDFMDAKMKAAVDNMLGGESEMTFLSDDSLCIKMSDAMTLELKLQTENNEQIVMMKRTYQTAKRQKEILINSFSSSWRPISEVSLESTLLKRDDEVISKPHL